MKKRKSFKFITSFLLLFTILVSFNLVFIVKKDSNSINAEKQSTLQIKLVDDNRSPYFHDVYHSYNDDELYYYFAIEYFDLYNQVELIEVAYYDINNNYLEKSNNYFYPTCYPNQANKCYYTDLRVGNLPFDQEVSLEFRFLDKDSKVIGKPYIYEFKNLTSWSWFWSAKIHT